MPPETLCPDPTKCPTHTAVEKIATDSQATKESVIRQEEVVKGVVNTVNKLESVNTQHHEKLFSKVNAVEVANAKKMTAKDMLPWIVMCIALAGLFFNIFTNTPAPEVRYVSEPYNGFLEDSSSRAAGRVPERISPTLRVTTPAHIGDSRDRVTMESGEGQ